MFIQVQQYLGVYIQSCFPYIFANLLWQESLEKLTVAKQFAVESNALSKII